MNDLEINCKKSKISCFRKRRRRREKKRNWFMKGEKIEEVETIKSLGYRLNARNSQNNYIPHMEFNKKNENGFIRKDHK